MRTSMRKLFATPFCTVLTMALAKPKFGAAQVTPVKTVRIAGPQRLATGVDFVQDAHGDLLTCIPHTGGTWELVRLHDWTSPAMTQQQTVMPGFFPDAGKKNLTDLSVHAVLDPRHNAVVCLANATWTVHAKNPSQGSTISSSAVAVVDASSMQTIASVSTASLGLLPLSSAWLLDDGDVAVASTTMQGNARGEVLRLHLPMLQASERCEYTWQAGVATPAPSSVATCATVAPDGIAALLKPSVSKQRRQAATRAVCADGSTAFCRLQGELDEDGRFGLAFAPGSKDAVPATSAVGVDRLLVYSAEEKKEIGQVPVRALGHGKVHAEVCASNSDHFLVTLSADLLLRVFALGHTN